ncbi:MAG: hypothetical protein OXE99_12665 [Cellvibrionales bacterium]|nr:hypothetical protein [Cellvibrionales bacterium]
MKAILFALYFGFILGCQPANEPAASKHPQERIIPPTGELKLWLNLLPSPFFYSSVQIDSMALIREDDTAYTLQTANNSPWVIYSLLPSASVTLSPLDNIPSGQYNALLVTINLTNTLVTWLEDQSLKVPFLYDTFGKTGEDALTQITIEIPITGSTPLIISEEKTANLAITLDNYAGHRWIPMDDNPAATDLSLLPVLTASTNIDISGEMQWIGSITTLSSDTATFILADNQKTFHLPLSKDASIIIDGKAQTKIQLENLLSETEPLLSHLKINASPKGFSIKQIYATRQAASHFFEGMRKDDEPFFGVLSPLEDTINNPPFFTHQTIIKSAQKTEAWELINGFIDADTLSHYHSLPTLTLARLTEKQDDLMTLNVLSNNGMKTNTPETFTLDLDSSATTNDIGLFFRDKNNAPTTPILWQSDKPLHFYTALPLLSEFQLASEIDTKTLLLNKPDSHDAYQQLVTDAGLAIDVSSPIKSIDISKASITVQIEGITPAYKSFHFTSQEKAIALVKQLNNDEYKLMVIAAKGNLDEQNLLAKHVTLRLTNYQSLNDTNDDLASLTSESSSLNGKPQPVLKGRLSKDVKYLLRLFKSQLSTHVFLKNQLGQQLPSPIDRQIQQAAQTQKRIDSINAEVKQARENFRMQMKEQQKRLRLQNYKRVMGVTVTEARKLNVTLSKADVIAITKKVISARAKKGQATSSINLTNDVSNEILNQKLTNLKFGDSKSADGQLHKHMTGSAIDADIEARLKALKSDSLDTTKTPNVRKRF